MKHWIYDFAEEIEKNAFPVAGIAMNGLMVSGTVSDIKQAKADNRLTNLRQNESSMRLPNPGQFSGSKRMDSFENSMVQKY